jgi:CRISPR-associated protein Csd1
VLQQLQIMGAGMGAPPPFYGHQPVDRVFYPQDGALQLAVNWPARGVRAVPTASRTIAIVPAPLADSAMYTFGAGGGTRTEAKHKAYLELVDAIADDLPALRPLAEALRAPASQRLGRTLEPQVRVGFALDRERADAGELVTDQEDFQRWWAVYCNRDNSAGIAECSCCGVVTDVVRKVPNWLRGIPNSLKGKAILASANDNSTWHYGHSQASSLCLCARCSSQAHYALNQMIGPRGCRLGPVVFTDWCPAEPNFTSSLVEAVAFPTTATLERLLENVAAGARGPDRNQQALAMMAHQARAVTAMFLRLPLSEMSRHALAWLERQGGPYHGDKYLALIGNKTGDEWWPGLLEVTAPGAGVKGVSVRQVVSALESVLTGAPWRAPISLPHTTDLWQLRVQLALRSLSGESMIPLEDDMPRRCGLLLALLEKIQKRAVRRLNRGLGERRLQRCLQQPTVVLGQLLAWAENHLAKLDRRNQGRRWREALTEALRGLVIPDRLDSRGRAALVLGYHEGKAT